MESEDPFTPPAGIDRRAVTQRGYSVITATVSFLVVGMVTAAPCACWINFRLFAQAVPHSVYLVVGTCFGIGLWIAVDRCIGDLSLRQIIVILMGTMTAFAIGGVLYIGGLHHSDVGSETNRICCAVFTAISGRQPDSAGRNSTLGLRDFAATLSGMSPEQIFESAACLTGMDAADHL